MLVQAIVRHRGTGRIRLPGEVYGLDPATARALTQSGLVIPVGDEDAPDWWALPDRELRITRSAPAGRPVVACLSIWNDRAALELTWPTWAPYVDAVVVFDGPYRAVSATAGSTDGLTDWLAQQDGAPPVSVHTEVWADQRAKRSQMLQAAVEAHGDCYLFIVDADEFVANPTALRTLPDLDVGWVTVTNPTIYRRRYGQPRVIRAMPDLTYRGRHHWLYAGDRLLATHQYGGPGVLHRLTGVGLNNSRGLRRSPERKAAKQKSLAVQFVPEAEAVTSEWGAASDRATGAREALHVMQVGAFDAGMVGYRLHTGINTATPHASVLATMHATNPFQAPVQYDLAADLMMCQRLFDEADVVHCHLDYRMLGWLERLGRVKDGKWVVIHHHGTMYRKKPGPAYCNSVDGSYAGLRLVSNLELLQYGDGLHWLPNPMPVAEYRRIRAGVTPHGTGTFRVAHSPSKRELKGTEAFLAACNRLHARGVPVEPVLIERLSHAESLAVKATCDAAFDSFWLGMQCSGLESAAMGLPVIAGDFDQRAGYEAHGLAVPYTVANDEDALVEALERLAMDRAYREAEAARVAAHVTDWHDEARVALRYLDLLDRAFHWRERMRVGTKRIEVAPDPETPKRRRPRTPKRAVPEIIERPEPLTNEAAA